jgi:peptidoglycan/LPS O-acetylase OafA/YrhL
LQVTPFGKRTYLSTFMRNVSALKQQKIIYLEGLRGIAAIIVVLCHLRNTIVLGFPDNLLPQLKESCGFIFGHVIHSFLNIVFAGNLAVYVFWFLSAYVISIKLFVSGNSHYLIQNISKRYFRLMIPCMASVVVAYLLLKMGMIYNLSLAELKGPQYQNGWLGSYYRFGPDFIDAIKSGVWETFFHYDEKSTYNGSLWTMEAELYGSFLCFGLFAFTGQFSFRRYITIAGIIISIVIQKYWMASFLLGYLMCDIDYSGPSPAQRIISLVTSNRTLNLIILLVMIVVAGTTNPAHYVHLFCSTLVVLVIMKTPILKEFLEQKIMVWLGRISFGVYLLHLPLICSLCCYLLLQDDNLFYQLSVAGLTLMLTLAIAHVFTKFIDERAVGFANRIGFLVVNRFRRGINQG